MKLRRIQRFMIHEEVEMGAQNPKCSRPCDSAVPLSAGLEKSLGAYAYAAAAASVGLLGLARPAQARVIYTHAHTTIPLNGGPVALDLNRDGQTDFSLSLRTVSTTDSRKLLADVAPGNQSNAVWGRGTFSTSRAGFAGEFAAALRRGFIIGPNNAYFQRGKSGLIGFARGYFPSQGTLTGGQWFQTKHRYLGLQFLIEGQVHYGWARLDVPAVGSDITLTGYAYETIPNKPIVAGQTKGADIVDETPQPIRQTTPPATLGRLALGSWGYLPGSGRKRSLAPNASQH
jgi:hypothetical protein